MSYEELKYKVVKIRKPHECIGCLGKFEKGAMLVARAYIWNGEFQSDYLCHKCDDVLNSMDSMDLEDGFMPGELKEGWEENYA